MGKPTVWLLGKVGKDSGRHPEVRVGKLLASCFCPYHYYSHSLCTLHAWMPSPTQKSIHTILGPRHTIRNPTICRFPPYMVGKDMYEVGMYIST